MWVFSRLSLFTSMLACVLAQSAWAQDAPPAAGVAGVAQVQARVVGIDPANNSATLQGPEGRTVEVAVNRQVGDVSKLRLGDTVNIEYRKSFRQKYRGVLCSCDGGWESSSGWV